MKQIYPSSKLMILVALLTGLNWGATAQTTTYSSGGAYTYTVPPTAALLGIDLAGAQGGTYSLAGGKGGRVQATLAVSGGEVLFIYVGAAGGNNNGGAGGSSYGGGEDGGVGGNSGGGSGGAAATDIRTVAGVGGLSSRLIVGGGGGGASFDCSYSAGGNGGYPSGASGGSNCGVTVTTGGSQTGVGTAGGTYSGYTGSNGSVGAGGAATYWGGGGGGGYYGGGGGSGGSGGGGSSYYGGAGVTLTSTTSGYQSGSGYVQITVLCNPIGAIVGNTGPVCQGATMSLSNPTGFVGGTWSSSNLAVATINPSTGAVTTLSPGNTVITYTIPSPCGGVTALPTTTLTVNQIPTSITASATSICAGATATLTDGVSGGAWTSSNTTIAAISSTGVMSGVAAGSAVITYRLPTGCSITTSETVSPLPAINNMIGGGAFCPGGTGIDIGLNGSATGISYQLFNSGVISGTPVTGTGSALDFGLQTLSGAYTAVATNITTSCTSNMAGSATVTANPLPAPIGGTTNACVGFSSTLTETTSGGTWSTSDAAIATIGLVSGNVTGIVAGTVLISYTLSSTGCKIGVPFIVNPLPDAIGGSLEVCTGNTTTLTDGTGGTWSSSSAAVATIGATSGIVSGISSGTATITYTSSAGCNATTPILVNALPVPYAVAGGGSFCASGTGVHVGLVYSGSGVSYQLYNSGYSVGAPVFGSNSGLDFGLQTVGGTYTVVATSSLSGCTNNMTGSVSVNVNPGPTVHNITGGGSFCTGTAGVPLGLDGSDTGVYYQLLKGATDVGPHMSGTGSPLSFGNIDVPGIYSVTAFSPSSGCGSAMAGTATISVNASPNVYAVLGGGDYCTGGTGKDISLSNSDAGVTYSLTNSITGFAGTFTGTGSAFDFGFHSAAGVYTVTASGGAGCTANMYGSATIVIDPLPAVNNVTGTGSYCASSAGLHVGLDYANTGIEYVLLYYGGAIDTFLGTGSGLDFGIEPAGIYTVLAINPATLCSNNMNGNANLTINALPNIYTVIGGASYCVGGPGPDISLSGSDPGVDYQLFRGGTPVGAALPGDGSPSLDFGDFTIIGTYTVVGTNPTTLCTSNMLSSATVAANPLPVVHLVTGGGNYCASGTGVHIMLNGSNTGVTYQLYNDSVAMGLPATGTGSALDLGLQTLSGIYTVIATNATTACTDNMAGSATININAAPAPHNVTGGGNYCVGGSGSHIGLDGSNTGINYQLNMGGIPLGGMDAGSGGTIDFGAQTTTGTYNVLATNPLTGCTSMMTGSASVGTNPLPNTYTLITEGGGNYCLGGVGADVYLAGGISDPGVSYQLYLGTTPVGSPIVSTVGGPVDFGPQTGAGAYKAIGTNTVTGCTQNMPGSVSVHAVSPTVYTVTGGGNYCLGDTGVHVMLAGSAPGVSYQLYTDLIITGTAVTGTGSAIDFGAQTSAGTYTVIASTISAPAGCTRNMASAVIVGINPLPLPIGVFGGGTICGGVTGPHVGLVSSVGGVNYQLYDDGVAVGAPVPGMPSMGSLDFGPQTATGTYTVIATNPSTTCTNVMSDSAVITVHPSPTPYAVTISNYGNYCAVDSGVTIGLANSDAGVNYQLFRASIAVNGPVAGTGVVLNMGLDSVAGIYSVVGTDASSGCQSNMAGTVTLTIIPLPTVFNVTGGGSYCAGGEGVHVGLDGSSIGDYYQLYDGSLSAGTIYGTGYPLDFGLEIATGTYNVIANSVITNCPNNMFGSANIAFDSILTPVVTLVAYPGNNVTVWHVDSIKAFVANGGPHPTYQWYVNGHLITGATSSAFVGYSFFNNDDVSCDVTSSGICGGLSSTSSMVLNLHNGATGVATINTNGSDIKLVPNPNKGVFTVKGTLGAANVDEEVLLEVTNMLGQVVYTNKVPVQNGIIDQQVQLGSSLANGMYILNLSSGSSNVIFHFVIEQ